MSGSCVFYTDGVHIFRQKNSALSVSLDDGYLNDDRVAELTWIIWVMQKTGKKFTELYKEGEKNGDKTGRHDYSRSNASESMGECE